MARLKKVLLQLLAHTPKSNDSCMWSSIPIISYLRKKIIMRIWNIDLKKILVMKVLAVLKNTGSCDCSLLTAPFCTSKSTHKTWLNFKLSFLFVFLKMLFLSENLQFYHEIFHQLVIAWCVECKKMGSNVFFHINDLKP